MIRIAFIIALLWLGSPSTFATPHKVDPKEEFARPFDDKPEATTPSQPSPPAYPGYGSEHELNPYSYPGTAPPASTSREEIAHDKRLNEILEVLTQIECDKNSERQGEILRQISMHLKVQFYSEAEQSDIWDILHRLFLAGRRDTTSRALAKLYEIFPSELMDAIFLQQCGNTYALPNNIVGWARIFRHVKEGTPIPLDEIANDLVKNGKAILSPDLRPDIFSEVLYPVLWNGATYDSKLFAKAREQITDLFSGGHGNKLTADQKDLIRSLFTPNFFDNTFNETIRNLDYLETRLPGDIFDRAIEMRIRFGNPSNPTRQVYQNFRKNVPTTELLNQLYPSAVESIAKGSPKSTAFHEYLKKEAEKYRFVPLAHPEIFDKWIKHPTNYFVDENIQDSKRQKIFAALQAIEKASRELQAAEQSNDVRRYVEANHQFREALKLGSKDLPKDLDPFSKDGFSPIAPTDPGDAWRIKDAGWMKANGNTLVQTVLVGADKEKALSHYYLRSRPEYRRAIVLSKYFSQPLGLAMEQADHVRRETTAKGQADLIHANTAEAMSMVPNEVLVKIEARLRKLHSTEKDETELSDLRDALNLIDRTIRARAKKPNPKDVFAQTLHTKDSQPVWKRSGTVYQLLELNQIDTLKERYSTKRILELQKEYRRTVRQSPFGRLDPEEQQGFKLDR